MASAAPSNSESPVGLNPQSALRLPARYYLDEQFLEMEKERIFSRSWLLAGHVSQLPETGSYFTLDLLGEHLMFVRDDDGLVRGFYNVCRHRAHQLVQGSGCKNAITCPYHAWTYELDGRLRHARNSDKVRGFQPELFSLVPIKVEEFLGWLFFNLDPKAKSFTSQFPALEAEIRAFTPRMDDLVAHSGEPSETTLRCNWKILLDNCIECYHCAPAHRAFVDLVDLDTYRITCHEFHTTHVVNSVKSQNAAYTYDPNDAVRHAVFWHLWPNITLGVMPGSANFGAFSIDPVSLDITRPRSYSLRLPDGPTALDRARDEYGANVLWPEDRDLCESVQKGIKSRAYMPGPFMVGAFGDGESEIATHFFQRKICEALAG